MKNMAKKALPRVDWANVRWNGPYGNFEGVGVEGMTLADRGGRPRVVAVDKPNDWRLKLFAAVPGTETPVDIGMKGQVVPFVRKGGEVLVASFGTREAMLAVVNRGLPAREQAVQKGVVDLTKAREERDRSGVPEPVQGVHKFPQALFVASKRHGCLVMSRWVGRIPEQFHRHRSAPVLELAGGTTVRAYGTHIDRCTWFVNGQTLRFQVDPTYLSDHEDRFLCVLDAETIGKLRTWQPPRKTWQPKELSEEQIEARITELRKARSGVYLDVCVETRFEPDPRADSLPWVGDVSEWPEWMEARSVKVSPPRTSGSGPIVRFDAPGIRKRGYPTVRLNNVWLVTGPWGDEVAGHCDPVELNEIRLFARGLAEDVDISLPNEPARVRTMGQVGALHKLLQVSRYGRGLPSRAFRPWREGCMAINNALGAMAVGQGQADYNRSQEERCRAEAERLEDRVQRLYERRKPAYLDYDLPDWLAEQEDGKYVKPREWDGRARDLRADVEECRNKARRLEDGVTAARVKYNEAVGRIEVLEDEWEDLVALLYPVA